MLKLIWDPAKNVLNRQKHGVSFEEAASVFCDEYGRIVYDSEHSDDEDRFLLLGMSNMPRLLVVCHCYRENDEIVRVISARKASNHEIAQYKGFKL